jgi:hypothetical protein
MDDCKSAGASSSKVCFVTKKSAQSASEMEIAGGAHTYFSYIFLDPERNDRRVDTHARVKLFFEVKQILSEFLNGPGVVFQHPTQGPFYNIGVI